VLCAVPDGSPPSSLGPPSFDVAAEPPPSSLGLLAGLPPLPAAEPVALGLLPAAPELTPGALGGGVLPFIEPPAPAWGDSGAGRLGSLGLEHAFNNHAHAHNAANDFGTSIFA
jgi:hypothetical protein